MLLYLLQKIYALERFFILRRQHFLQKLLHFILLGTVLRRRVILTILAFTSLCTSYSSIITFTIFFLTLWFFAYTTLGRLSCTFTFYLCLCLGDHLLMLIIIQASTASTINTTYFTYAMFLKIISERIYWHKWEVILWIKLIYD